MRRLPRPVPAQTPLQGACYHLGEAFRFAQTDHRTLEAFIGIAIERLAREAGRLPERERLR